MTSSRTLKVVSLVAFSAVLGFAFPVNVTPTFLLSDEDKRVLTRHLESPAVANVPVDAHADAPSGPMPAVAAVNARRVAGVTERPAPQPSAEESLPVGSYRMRDPRIARVLAKEERTRD